LTSHARPVAGTSTGAVVEFGELVSRAISVPTYRRTEYLSSNPTLPRRLLRKVSDERNLVALALARLDHHKDPEDQNCDAHRNQKNPSQNRDHPQNKVHDRYCDPKKDGLPRMKADKRAAVIRLHHQKDDCRNNRDVSHHAGGSLRQAAALLGS